MPERIPQSATIRVPLQAYLAGTVTAATGKTIAVTISKNGAAYGNPSAGATNAVEIASGSYYVDLSTTDTGTVGPLFVKGAEGTIDNVIQIYSVAKATNAGFTALPDTACTTNASLLTSGTSTDQVSVSAGKVLLQATQTGVTIPTVTTLTNLPTITTDWLTGTGVAASAVTKIQAGLATPTNITAGTITTVTNLTNLPAITTDWLTGTGVAASAVTKIQAGLATPTNITAGTITTVTTLTNLPAITTDWITAAGVSAAAVTKIQAGLSTYAGGAVASVTAPVTLDKTQALSAARALDAIADTSLTINDALHCAIAAATGQESVVGTAYTVKTPSTATVLRTFALDDGDTPSTRT